MRLRLAVLGFVGGLGLAVACGPTGSATGTSLFVRVFFNPGLGTRALVLSGADSKGLEVFPRSQRPETIDGGAFTSPQTVRILLVDSLAGKPLTLTVLGVTATNESVESGSAQVTPALNVEKELEVRLAPFQEQTDGGDDGGVIPYDAGLLPDGGNPDGGSCSCGDGGCCSPLSGHCATRGAIPPTGPGGTPPYPLIPCGAGAGQFCRSYCTPIGLSDSCVNGECRCGSSAQCEVGQQCVASGGGGRCVCNEQSCPNGCCKNNLCVPHAWSSCGTAGLQCDTCATVVQPCNSGSCTGGCPAIGSDSCCSGTQDEQVAFPMCRGGNGVCLGCDPMRSDRCGIATGTCDCGTQQGPCRDTQQCRRQADGGARCDLLVITLPQ